MIQSFIIGYNQTDTDIEVVKFDKDHLVNVTSDELKHQDD